MYERVKRYWKILGPGLVTGAADDDPSGIATYSQTGAMFGYSQMWVALFSYPFMTTVQEMCGRIGLVTGDGLSGVIRKNYSRRILWMAVAVLVIANTINIGADLGAMASALQLVVPFPFLPLLVSIALGTLLLQIFVPYPTYAKFLKYLALTLFAYVAVAFMVKVDWFAVLRSTLVPHVEFSRDYILNIAAFLGTTISPYLFFWQADEEVEEEIVSGKISDMGAGSPEVSAADMSNMRADTVIGMLISNLVAFFILVTVASTLGAAGITHIETAAQAAEALRPLAGDFAFLLFAAGIFGTGLLAIPVLAGSAGYAVAEALEWKAGLGKRFGQAQGFYIVISLATLVGLLVNFTPIGPMTMLYYAAMLNGVLAPPLIVLILLISNNERIMGGHTNGIVSNVLGWGIAGVMSLVGIAAIASFFV
jgi:NRAMP (natural resistance-associated macrophage protein)-like metal ion transporter